jgi:hypothetical protein
MLAHGAEVGAGAVRVVLFFRRSRRRTAPGGTRRCPPNSCAAGGFSGVPGLRRWLGMATPRATESPT